jgi:hypothetical protein
MAGLYTVPYIRKYASPILLGGCKKKLLEKREERGKMKVILRIKRKTEGKKLREKQILLRLGMRKNIFL